MLQSTGSQRVRHDQATEQQQQHLEKRKNLAFIWHVPDRVAKHVVVSGSFSLQKIACWLEEEQGTITTGGTAQVSGSRR